MNTSSRKSILQAADTLVVKVGSRVLSGSAGHLDLQQVESLARQLAILADAKKQIVLVSSGAVASGVGKLQLARRPADLAHLQAIAAVGQAHLIQTYESYLSKLGRHAAQILLVADDLELRTRYLNVRNTLLALLELGVIPIINENDTVAVEELQSTFGDNDRLAAMVAGLFVKPALIILSDVSGVYDREPNHPQAQVLNCVSQVDESITQLATKEKSGIGKGGMASKLRAAQFVTRSGSPVVIAGGREQDVLLRVMDGEPLGTFFQPQSRGLSSKKRWLGASAQPVGSITVDAGAGQAMRIRGSSLLAIGVTAIHGSFQKGDVIAVCDAVGKEFARGLTNYTSAELDRIRGLHSQAISETLGHCPYEEVIHRDNLAWIELPSGG